MHGRRQRFLTMGLIGLGTGLAWGQPAQAGLLDKVIEGSPKQVELTPDADLAAAYQEAFTPKGMFGSAPDPVEPGGRKVAIAGFQVEFATEQKGISQGGGASAGLTSTTDVVYTLKGVTDAQMQAVTDRLYTAFAAILRDKGYDVLPAGALAQTAYQDALQKANQPPVHHERGAALDLVVTPTEKDVDNASVIVSAKDTAPEVFSHFLAGLGPGPRTADALQASVVHVRLKVNFTRFEESGWFNPEMDGQPRNTLGTAGTFLQVFTPGGQMKTYPLANTVLLPHRLAETANAVEASTGQTAQRAAGGVGRALAGGLLKGGIGGLTDMVGGAIASTHSVMGSGNYEVVAASDYEDTVAGDGTLALKLLAQPFPK